jgi:hypothetical protein
MIDGRGEHGEQLGQVMLVDDRLIWALYDDPDLTDVSGRTLIGIEIADAYGITDDGGRKAPS